MAPNSSIRPVSTTSNKEDLSIFDDVLFNEFVDGDQFDFSDSSYARSVSAASGDSWFDDPEPSRGVIEAIGTAPSSPKDFDAGNKTFVLDNLDEADQFPLDPLLEAAAGQDSAPSTTPRADIGFRPLPSTVETIRRSQSCGVKKGDRRRRPPESPTKTKGTTAEMSQPSSRRGQKEAWANQLERSVDPQALHSPLANRYAPMSPPPTMTQNRYQQQQQQQYPQQQAQQQRLMSHSSLVSPLTQAFPQQQQQMSYFSPLPTPLTSTHPPQAYAQQQPFYQPLDPYFSSTAAVTSPQNPSFPTFSNPFPSDDTAWEHDPILSSMTTTFPTFSDFSIPNTYGSVHQSQSQSQNSNMYNDTKVQPWAPPLPPPAQSQYHATHTNYSQYMPLSAPIASTQHQYYTHTHNPHNTNLNTYPNPPHTAQPSSAYAYATQTYAAPPTLLSVPKTRRRNKTPQPESETDSDSDSECSSTHSRRHRTRTSRSKTPLSPTRTTRTRASSRAPQAAPDKKATSSSSSSRHKSHSYNTPLSPRSPQKTKSRTTSRREKDKSSKQKDPFVNLTAQDSKKILTGVAPSGSSKTKAKRDKEEADKRRQFSEAATRAVREAGGDVKVLERVGLY